ncbi:hippurate hydrolase [Polymorphobacter multimanifer]|uniref:M20 metallopeptidase family protein n=1 Tax=Polymorphobacter multimanifer TaxID=1070431 RepID=UPI0016676E3D|nr:M20 family metallopeptidase [Polymorphobacter multimanifer]GGI71122.1 hippurate hydrolase [Polymorphobacter multimanifer]
MSDLLEAAVALSGDLTTLRRAIHAEPEIGLHNPLTAAKIRDALAGLPPEWRSGPSTTGLVAHLRGPQNGRTVLLRGDTDALPMPEDTGLAFASPSPNTMHACGHDSHVAMLVGAAKLLCARREQLAGSVMFMFQPGEEGHHGARFMLEDGLLDPLPDAAFALHLTPNGRRGVFAGRPGPLLASSDRLSIPVHGRGGHASMPHDALDPMPIACEVVLAIQSRVTRAVPIFDPAIVAIGELVAGTTDNVIPAQALMVGTVRPPSPERRSAMQAGLTRLVTGIAAAHGASADVRFEPGFPVALCDARAVALGRSVTQDLFGADRWEDLAHPIMGAEDFAYVLEKVPGAMFFLGAAAEGSDWRQCCGLHSNRMTLDEAVMPAGAALHAAIAERFLSAGFTNG